MKPKGGGPMEALNPTEVERLMAAEGYTATLFMIPISPNQSLHMPGLASLSPGQPWDLQV